MSHDDDDLEKRFAALKSSGGDDDLEKRLAALKGKFHLFFCVCVLCVLSLVCATAGFNLIVISPKGFPWQELVKIKRIGAKEPEKLEYSTEISVFRRKL